jgi:hypothetical protein
MYLELVAMILMLLCAKYPANVTQQTTREILFNFRGFSSRRNSSSRTRDARIAASTSFLFASTRASFEEAYCSIILCILSSSVPL